MGYLQLEISEAAKATHYRAVRRMIAKAMPGLADIAWFTQSSLAPATYKDRLSYLKSCFRWAVMAGLVKDSPYEKLKPRKAAVDPVKPFSKDEIQCILAGFKLIAPHYSLGLIHCQKRKKLVEVVA